MTALSVAGYLCGANLEKIDEIIEPKTAPRDPEEGSMSPRRTRTWQGTYNVTFCMFAACVLQLLWTKATWCSALHAFTSTSKVVVASRLFRVLLPSAIYFKTLL